MKFGHRNRMAAVASILSMLPACQTLPPQMSSSFRSAVSASLIDATNNQDQRFAQAFDTVESWVARKAFPGAVIAVGVNGKLVALKSFGKMSSTADAASMPTNAIFDLASVTKVSATTTAAALLYDRGRLDLEKRVVDYIPEFAGTVHHDQITVRNLLTHSTGLFVPELLWEHAHSRIELLGLIYKMPVVWAPGSQFQYRDENMILLGEIIERISGKRLDRFLDEEAFARLGMNDTAFNPPAAKIMRIPPTEQDNIFRHTLVHGVVHDENAYVMGGVAGHAGLFSTASDLSRLAQLYLSGGVYDGKRILKASTISTFSSIQNIPAGSSRALGWDTPGGFSGFAGARASPTALLHSGFTGTSMYIDPARNAFIILLTNRVNPTRENKQIAQARVAIHTAVLTALDTEASAP